MQSKEYFSSISIDSFKIVIPFDICTLIDRSLIDERTKIEIAKSTSEIHSEEKLNTSKVNSVLRNAIPLQFEYFHKERNVEIKINSKHIFEKYLEGIHSNNIRYLYDLLMSFELFYIDYQSFIDCRVVDVDIKKDMTIPLDIYRKNILSLYNFSKEKRPLVKKFDSNKSGYGIQFRDRNNLPTLTKPFIKIYHKLTEAKTKDLESISKCLIPFFDKYIGYENLTDKVRVEATIKNQKYYKKYFNTDKEFTLNNIVSQSQESFHSCIKQMFGNHLNEPIKKPNITTNLTQSQRTHLLCFKLLMERYEADFERALTIYLDQTTEDKTERYRAKKMVTELYKINEKMYDLEKLNELNKNNNILFNFIGW